jgi:hypothetical protein
MFARLASLFRRPTPPVTPQFDEAVARKLTAEGKAPATLVAEAAEPSHIPPRPVLPGFSGLVRFELTMDAEGAVKAVQMDGAPFDHVTALEAWAYGWTFRPARLEGKPHPCRMVYEVHWD